MSFRIALTAFLATVAPAAIFAEPVLTELRAFQDSLDNTAKVNAPLDPIKGIVEDDLFYKGFAGFVDGISIYLPEDRELCLRYITLNDLYHGSQEFRINGAPGWVDREFPESEHRDILERYEANTFLTSALLRDTCNSLPEIGAPERPLIRAIGSEGASYLAVVHIDTQAAKVLVLAAGQREPVATEPCVRFPEGEGVAFNAVCPLPEETFAPNHRAFLAIEDSDGTVTRIWINVRFPGEPAR
ncbi:hypothetical protein [uncultured Jannaschia sp.]|uniref:hypothetical protein n=1 Tax=uncultured Jannaschia sp. TaxID=293347 RepID=UPI00262BAE2B|nr:hypothetical protein [uncultured Jannaschia sp.]